MNQSPYLEANSRLACLLFNRKVHYRVHKSPRLDPILNQINPLHRLTARFLRIHFNVMLSSTRSSVDSSGFRTKMYAFLIFPFRATRSHHP
jgi:hypothetical protein